MNSFSPEPISTSEYHLSVIIPAKNEEDNLGRCIDSIINYLSKITYEIIVIDNGSLDNTVDIAIKKGANVHILPGLSVSAMRNYGARISHFPILAFIDADCFLSEHWLSSALRHFDDPRVACVGSTPTADENGTWVERTWSLFRARRKNIEVVPWLNSSNFIVRKSVFNELGGFSEQLATCEDVDICYRIKKNYTIIYDPAVQVTHLGEPKTIHAFFKKEVWRGKSNYSGIHSHGISISEIKSLALPIYYLFSTIFLLYGLLWGGKFFSVISSIFFVIPLIAFFVWMVKQFANLSLAAQLAFLFLIYSLGRSLALFNLISGTSFAEGKK